MYKPIVTTGWATPIWHSAHHRLSEHCTKTVATQREALEQAIQQHATQLYHDGNMYSRPLNASYHTVSGTNITHKIISKIANQHKTSATQVASTLLMMEYAPHSIEHLNTETLRAHEQYSANKFAPTTMEEIIANIRQEKNK